MSKINKIFEAGELPENEKIYLKKDWLGWRVVNKPSKWYHYIIGSKKNAIILLIILIITACFYFGVKELLYSQQQMIFSTYNCYIPINTSGWQNINVP